MREPVVREASRTTGPRRPARGAPGPAYGKAVTRARTACGSVLLDPGPPSTDGTYLIRALRGWSRITSVKPYLVAVRRLVGLMTRLHEQHGLVLPELDLGGGHGIAYRPGDEALDLTALARRVRAELTDACATAGLPVPRLIIEPGRAIAGPAGIAVYRVLSVKHTGHTVFVAVDGGMSDNPRPALYGVRYAPRLIGRHSTAATARATVVGRHCEAGDVLAADADLPADVRPGDLLAVPVAGAYHLSMASGYNLVGRPPVVAVRDGLARLLVRRESLEDIRSRDVGL